MSSKRSAAALGLGAAAGAVAFYVLSRDDDNKEALLDGLESLREVAADVTARVRKAAEGAVERFTTATEPDPPVPPAPAPSPPKASPLADHEAFDEEGDDEEAPEEQDEDDALADAREAMASPDGDATPNTGGNPSPTVSPFRVTYPIGGGTTPTKPPPEEEDEARALAAALGAADAEEDDESRELADAIDAAASDALHGDGFIGSRELTAQLLQAADASRAPCRSPFAELGDGEGLPQQ